MSILSAAHAGPAGRNRPTFSSLPGGAVILVACLALLLGFHYSLRQTLVYLRSDNPVGYVPFVPVVAAIFFWRLALRLPRDMVRGRELLLDTLVALPFGLVALYLLAILPSQLSWGYWLDRYDLLALPLAFVAVVVLLWGARTAWALRPALAFSFLIWPQTWTLIYSHLAGPLAAVSATVVDLVLSPLPIGVHALASEPQTFSAGSGAHQVLIGVGQTCSGTGVITAVLLLCLPALRLCGGSDARKAGWLATGICLALLSNILRLIVLLVVATVSPAFALGVLHPVLGVVFFAALVVAMLVLLPRLGLRWPPALPQEERAGWSLRPPLPVKPLLAVLGMAALLFAVLDRGLTDYNWLASPSALPVLASADPKQGALDVPGWSVATQDPLDWRQIFGNDSAANIYAYSRPDGVTVYAQDILTPDAGSLSAYSIENCDLFHWRTITGMRRIDLGHGMTGMLLDSKSRDATATESVLYWTQVVQIDGRQFYNRVALFVDPVDGRTTPSIGSQQLSLGKRLAYNFLQTFSNYRSEESTTTLRATHGALESLASGMLEREVGSRQ